MADPPFIPGLEDISAISDLDGVSPIPAVQPIGAPLPTVTSGRGKAASVDVGGYWIDHYKRCKQKTTGFCKAIAAGFAGGMAALGHKVAFVRGEQDASPRQWAAPTDKDAAGIETVEFAFLATHSGTHGHELRGSKWLFWWLATFDSPDGCIVSTIKLNRMWRPINPSAPTVTMRLGEGRLRWAVLDGCRSLHIRIENERDPGARAQLAEVNPARTWGRCLDGVNMLFGFTGLSSDASWTAQRGASFGRRAGRGEPLADSWLDEAYSYWVDDVPVAFACGRTREDAVRRLQRESLKSPGDRLMSRDIGGYHWMWRS
jgi:hypothetical protein